MAIKTADDAIALVNTKANGRTRYEGQEPFVDELLVAEIERLRATVEKLLADFVRVNITLGDIQLLIGIDRLIKNDLREISVFIDNSVARAVESKGECNG